MQVIVPATLGSAFAEGFAIVSSEPMSPRGHYHSVQFVDYAGNLLASQLVLNGTPAAPPETLARQGASGIGHQFSGWQSTPSDIEPSNITSDVVFTARYTQVTASGAYDTLAPSYAALRACTAHDDMIALAGTVYRNRVILPTSLRLRRASNAFDGGKTLDSYPIAANLSDIVARIGDAIPWI